MILKKSFTLTFTLCLLLGSYCQAKTPNNSSSVAPIDSSKLQSIGEKVFTVGEGRAEFTMGGQQKTGSDINGTTYSKSFSFPITQSCPSNYHYELMLSLNHVGYNFYENQNIPNKARTVAPGQETWMILNVTKLANIEDFSPAQPSSDGKSVSSTVTINAALAAQHIRDHYCHEHDDVAVCYKYRTYEKILPGGAFTLGFNYTVNCALNH